MKIEQAIIKFLSDWIVLVLPISVALIRLGLFRFAGEAEEVYRNLFSVPQDLVFIAVSFILAGLSRTIPAFAAHYKNDRDADLMGALHIFGLLGIAWLLCKSNKYVIVLQRNFRVSWTQINRWRKQQESFNWKNVPPEIGSRLVWSVVYICLISIIVAIELLIACASVGESLQRIQP
jgi:hypothetical protein